MSLSSRGEVFSSGGGGLLAGFQSVVPRRRYHRFDLERRYCQFPCVSISVWVVSDIWIDTEGQYLLLRASWGGRVIAKQAKDEGREAVSRG